MAFIEISTKIDVCLYDELSTDEKNLIDAAKQSTKNAYAPYSNFQVGCAVLLDNNQIVIGNNQENAAFPSGLCAERITLFAANAQFPNQAVTHLAIAAYGKEGFTRKPITPCGSCRQVLAEVEKRFRHTVTILLYGEEQIYRLRGINGLLPLCFDEF